MRVSLLRKQIQSTIRRSFRTLLKGSSSGMFRIYNYIRDQIEPQYRRIHLSNSQKDHQLDNFFKGSFKS